MQKSFSFEPEMGKEGVSPPLRLPLSVTQLTQRIKTTLEDGFSVVTVQGEISNFKASSSGHLYFSLKDQNASLSVVLFRWELRKKLPLLEEGCEVICQGKVSVYSPRGTYQLIAETVELAGQGMLAAAFEALKAKLLKEGLFAVGLKKPLPLYPKKVAVITSPTGAVIQDIQHILKRRAPHIHILVIPTLVQGDQAALQIKQAIEKVNEFGLAEIILLARGGGSQEDLWCFNDEALARAIVDSPLPVVSAVGHETDFTISDFVADVRAPTPSAAAEIISQAWVSVAQTLVSFVDTMVYFIKNKIDQHQLRLSTLQARCVNPKYKIRDQAQRVDELTGRMQLLMDKKTAACRHTLHLIDYIQPMERIFQKYQFQLVQLQARCQNPKHKIERYFQCTDDLLGQLQFFMQQKIMQSRFAFKEPCARLDALSPLKVLTRGYTLVRGPHQRLVKSIKEVKKDDHLSLVFQDGCVAVSVL